MRSVNLLKSDLRKPCPFGTCSSRRDPIQPLAGGEFLPLPRLSHRRKECGLGRVFPTCSWGLGNSASLCSSRTRSSVIINSRETGFTLLEVLVAIAILALGLLTILSLHNQSIKANAEINEQTDAAMAGRIYLNYALVKSQYDGFDLYFYQDGKSYTIEELYPYLKFQSDEEQQLIGDMQIVKDYVSVLNAKNDSEYLRLEFLR